MCRWAFYWGSPAEALDGRQFLHSRAAIVRDDGLSCTLRDNLSSIPL